MRRYPGIETAHVWNAQSVDSGQNSNGQFYFTGRTIYSYGSHFPIAWIAPDGAALFNAAGYSPTTGKHQSYAAQAASNRRIVYLPNFRDLHDSALRWIKESADARKYRDTIRRYIKANAPELAVTRFGNSRWSEGEGEGESAGAYLTRLAGLPAASWPKLEREGRKLAERNAKATAKRERESAIAEAKRIADTPESELKRGIRAMLAEYSPESRLQHSAKVARQALITANKAGFSKKRVESIRNAKRLIAAALNDCERLAAIVKRRQQTRADISTIRLTASLAGARPLDVAEAAERLSKLGLLPFTARRQLELIAEKARGAAERLKLERIAAENARKAERIAAWRNGGPSVYFDAPSGGAALRISGDTLETSHGASVPLGHAVRVFRFVKLCRERGESWQRNGRTIRVGHYQVDSVSADGSFKAGCHHFTWPEIESAARTAGVFDAPADASAVEVRESINV